MSEFQNYAQIRAKNAWAAAKKWKKKWEDENKGKEDNKKAKFQYDVVVQKLPSMIIENGLLGALAFAIDKKGEKVDAGKFYEVFQAIIEHLKSSKINDKSVLNCSSVENWIENITKQGADQFRITTSECMAYLAYLRRFAKKEGE